ncbi:hypothetical protein GCM10011494_36240 [Novosphingobium endophyticum]|uniref:Uncharacterized protein n=1 Tax=Novosphingobium endophyticum TaxID=1955250 RepID=A0A916X7I8_9SPHN|nr:hypothetical protein GCM10011494_36240 [Novosphingobium endophyticum]
MLSDVAGSFFGAVTLMAFLPRVRLLIDIARISGMSAERRMRPNVDRARRNAAVTMRFSGSRRQGAPCRSGARGYPLLCP